MNSEVTSWFTAPKGKALRIIQIMSAWPNIKFSHQIIGETGWIFKRLHVRFELCGEEYEIRRVESWMNSLKERRSQDQQ